jgi:hypothetical protein
MENHQAVQAKVLAYLKSGHSITALEALRRFGSMRLAVHIHKLRALGHEIVTERVKRNGKSFGRYSLSTGNTSTSKRKAAAAQAQGQQ